MALSAKLVMRQGQSLVMTPQLLQAIKLLQLSNLELASFIEEELERNPLLERAEDRAEPPESPTERDFEPPASTERAEGDWASSELAVDHGALESSLGTELGNAFETGIAGPAPSSLPDQHGLSATSWTGTAGSGGEDEPSSFDSYVARAIDLRDHLTEQLAVAVTDPADRLVGHALVDAIDDAGYLTEHPGEIALRLGTSLGRVEAVLAAIHLFEPTGVGARNLAECLELQLREQNRFDPAMRALVANLDLLAKRDYSTLKRLCGVDDEDMAEMVAEIRRLDPKTGRAFGGAPVQTVVPDVYVRAAPDGSWLIELNADVLPRLLVNGTYHARVARGGGGGDADRSFVANCLQSANWLTKSLEQRARTILKVATEIVRQQDAFFARGVEYLRPLNLKTVADAIGMHESTVSRVTSNKYVASPPRLYELRYFFTGSIAASYGRDAHSAEAVRFRIKQMIDGENPADILSDDAIVMRLKAANVVIARRTVAKYRESLRIPSSVERRREKAMGLVG